MSDVIMPRERHQCLLPAPTKYPARTLAKCATCKRWHWRGEVYVGFGCEEMWLPVRWYHFILRRSISTARRADSLEGEA